MDNFSFALTLTFSEDTNCVNSALTPGFNQPALNRELIEKRLFESGYGDYFRHEIAIEELIATDQTLREQGQKLLLVAKKKMEQASKDEDKSDQLMPSAEHLFALLGKEIPTLEIAEKKDGEVEITTCEDDIQAFITIHQPYGGERANESIIDAAIKKAGIKAQLNQSTIDRCIETGVADKLPLAKGVKPRRGKDSQFVRLKETEIYLGPQIDEKGKANFHELYEFVVVEPGEELMRRTSPSDGNNGVDVFGKPILAEPGEILPFCVDMEGSKVSDDDPNVIVATIKGHPVFHDRGASVDNVLQIKNANLATGNIDFDGSVCVEEDVADGIRIKATGDVTILGTVGKATIEAGHNISIKQGLIGGTKSNQEPSDEFGAFMQASGKVSAKFASYAKIEAGDLIEVAEYASHCSLTAKNKVLIGYKTGKGSLIGGNVQAFDTIFAKIIGSTGGTQTNLRVGAAADTLISLRTISQKINASTRLIHENSEKLSKLAVWAKVAGVNEQTKSKISELNEETKTLLAELNELEKNSDVLKKLLMRTKKSQVIARNKLFHNVAISILSYTYKVNEEMSGGKFHFEAREIVYEK